MSNLPDPADNWSDEELQRAVERAFATAMADHTDWTRVRAEYGSSSPEAKVAEGAYTSSEEHWRFLRDKAAARRKTG